MTYPNILVFVDFPVDDVDAANAFYSTVFGWEVEERIPGIFHRIVPGQNFKVDDGSQGPTGNLHMGIALAANVRPHPDPAPPAPTHLAGEGRSARAWILVSDDDSMERILAAAVEHVLEQRAHRPGVQLVDQLAHPQDGLVGR